MKHQSWSLESVKSSLHCLLRATYINQSLCYGPVKPWNKRRFEKFSTKLLLRVYWPVLNIIANTLYCLSIVENVMHEENPIVYPANLHNTDLKVSLLLCKSARGCDSPASLRTAAVCQDHLYHIRNSGRYAALRSKNPGTDS